MSEHTTVAGESTVVSEEPIKTNSRQAKVLAGLLVASTAIAAVSLANDVRKHFQKD